MNFYESIAKYYQDIFPLNKAQINFVKTAHPQHPPQLIVLDIGCAIGDFSIALSEHYKHVTGIDLDKGMVNRANEKTIGKSNLKFACKDMLAIDSDFGEQSFDIITCFGNTLVHLDSKDSVLIFFQQAKKVLRPKGRLLFQIINYDRVIDQKIDHLPTIENEILRFERNYLMHDDATKVDFESILTSKENGNQIKNCIPLLALRKSNVDEMLSKAGFQEISYYGNFKRDPLTKNSMPLVVEAKA